ncbi:lectin [Ktedonosporobacter rubrisoli]|uniref:Lectin n=1 Tax=Ktedonosporobacter rubrisoli TaxID=2509675 RepID=A0A4P6JJW1_KTERU|nr:lectin [Ktedonosporobacter rubrisoli]QBD75425.1 lectin [Ktedonosporobacter rubrisoli]
MVNILQPDEALYPGDQLNSNNDDYIFILQDDGNLVLYCVAYETYNPLWASGTNGYPAQMCIMQADGNLVIYDPAGDPLWASGTNGYDDSYLIIQDDGNAVIYTPYGDPVWATGTNGEC